MAFDDGKAHASVFVERATIPQMMPFWRANRDEQGTNPVGYRQRLDPICRPGGVLLIRGTEPSSELEDQQAPSIQAHGAGAAGVIADILGTHPNGPATIISALSGPPDEFQISYTAHDYRMANPTLPIRVMRLRSSVKMMIRIARRDDLSPAAVRDFTFKLTKCLHVGLPTTELLSGPRAPGLVGLDEEEKLWMTLEPHNRRIAWQNQELFGRRPFGIIEDQNEFQALYDAIKALPESKTAAAKTMYAL